MTTSFARIAVGLAIASVVAGSLDISPVASQPKPAPAPGSPQLSITPLPASFGPRYGAILSLVDELGKTQADYLAAKTSEQKSALERKIKELVERIIAAATQLKDDLGDNRYVSVPGFSVALGIPPEFNFQLDFTFKPR